MRTILLLTLVTVSLSCARRAPESSPETGASAPVPPPDEKSLSWNIRPLLAGGTMEPEGLEDWPAERRLAKGSEVFKNLKLLGDDRADMVMAAMQSMKPSVGLGCKACHVKGDAASDEREDKQIARGMMQMAAKINQHYAGGHLDVSCYTCHRGEDHPENEVPKDKLPPPPPPGTPPLFAPEDADKPAEEVFENIEILKGLKARELAQAMVWFSGSLGVKCAHCHEPGKWADDSKKEKKIARKMLTMVGELNRDFFEGEREVTCWTCHRGNTEPTVRAEATAAAN